jgi:surfactin synthase thioesterase subunit
LPDGIETCVVALPGRGRRFAEPAVDSLRPLVEELYEAVQPLVEEPFALFGHSMGALVAYELARMLRRRRSIEPVHLFVSGAGAPQLPRRVVLHTLPDAELLSELQRLNGIDPELLREPELLALLLPTVRADLKAAETYESADGPALSCPLSTFGGSRDWLAPPDQLHAWGELTTGPFSVEVFDGDHFFLHGAHRALTERVIARLAHLLS